MIDTDRLIRELDADATKWAKAFMGKIGQGQFTKDEIDESLMTSWFATIIETAKEAERKVAK